jgi:preprotein translocase subunit SecE
MVAVETRKMDKNDEASSGGGLSAIPRKFSELKSFFGEVKSELKKVTWPSRKEVQATTVVVIVTTVFFGFYLYGLDLLLSQVFAKVLRQ